MTDKVETSRPEGDLTDENAIVQESTEGSTEPTPATETAELPEEAKNFQHAIQKTREREKAEKARADKAEADLNRLKEEKKQRELAELGEADRFKAIAEEELSKRGKLEMKLAVQSALEGKNIPAPVRELIIETPWAIPPVARELEDGFTWDEAIDSVQRHLPDYVDSLVVTQEPSTIEENTDVTEIDAERTVSSGVVKNHIYSQEEINKLAKDPVQWEKHREAIQAQMKNQGGTIK